MRLQNQKDEGARRSPGMLSCFKKSEKSADQLEEESALPALAARNAADSSVAESG